MKAKQQITRRRFIYGAGMGVAMFNILPGSLVRGADAISPSQKLNVAGIGIGGQGGHDVDEVAKLGHNIVALCDVDEKHAAKEYAKYPGARQFKDYRVMLDKLGKEIEAVVIGTPDHTHALIALEALGRGKHVYCEKPLAHNIYEVRKLMEVARKSKLVTQLGNQGHSSDSIRQLCEWVWAGAVGPVHTVHAGCDAFKKVYCQMPNLEKVDQHYAVPEGLDYDLWVGPVPFKPYTPLWVPWNWRGWMPFGTGAIGDWFCHVMDPTFWALDLDAPETIRAEVDPEYDLARDGLTYPPGTKITYEFPAKKGRGKVTVVWHDGKTTVPRPASFSVDDKVPGTGAILFGAKGMIVHGSHGGGNCYLTPENLMDAHSGKNAPAQKLTRIKGHHWDWADAIRTGRQAGSNFAYGGPLTQSALLGAIAIRFPAQTLNWNNKQGRFTNHPEANAYVHPEYRHGWRV